MSEVTERPNEDNDTIESVCGPILDPVLLSVVICWGGNFVAFKYLMDFVGPTGLLLVRYALITVLLLAVLELRGQLRTGNSKTMWVHLSVAGALIMGGQQIAFVLGLNLTAAGQGSLLFSTAPIFTALIVAAIGQERITAANWVGIGAAMAGTAMVILGGAGAEHVPDTHLLGDLTMLLSSLGYAIYMVVSKPLMARYGALKVVTLSYLLGLIVVTPIGAGEALAADWAALGAVEWFAMVWLVLFAGAYGFVAWYWRIARTSASRVAVYQYFVPVVAMILGAILLHERPAPVQIFGAAIVLLGLYFARRRDPAICPT